MGSLDPVALDIETSGLDADAVVTVVGFSHALGDWLALNSGGREVDAERLETDLSECVDRRVEVVVRTSEGALLETVGEFVDGRLDGDAHYLTAYNGERWNGGFDLPFLRSACLRTGVEWPFGDVAYADTMDAVERFDTNGAADLDGVYEALVGRETCDPFDDSASAVAAFEDDDWAALCRHNLADVERTRELAELAGRFVPASDFSMKNLRPPGR